jgi:hypothetical protein
LARTSASVASTAPKWSCSRTRSGPSPVQGSTGRRAGATAAPPAARGRRSRPGRGRHGGAACPRPRSRSRSRRPRTRPPHPAARGGRVAVGRGARSAGATRKVWARPTVR